jgi:hypothetical protein
LDEVSSASSALQCSKNVTRGWLKRGPGMKGGRTIRSAVHFDHDACLFDEVAMAQDIRPYDG